MDLKHFLRLHIDAGGDLTVYPIGVDRVRRHWELRPDDPPGAPWFVPGVSPLEPHLIEPPIRIGQTDRHAAGEGERTASAPRQVGFGFGFGAEPRLTGGGGGGSGGGDEAAGRTAARPRA